MPLDVHSRLVLLMSLEPTEYILVLIIECNKSIIVESIMFGFGEVKITLFKGHDFFTHVNLKLAR